MRLPTIILAGVLATALGACAGTYQATFNSPLLEPRQTSQLTKNGIAVTIEPVTRENLLRFPELARVATWQEPDPRDRHPLAPAQISRVHWLERSATIALVPLPAFRASIANGGSQPASFRPAIQLEDNLRRQYRPILDRPTLRLRFTRDMLGTNSHMARDGALMLPFSNAIDDLPILNPSVTVEPSGSWTGYVVFETGAVGADEYNTWMSSVQSFTLRLQSSIQGGDGPAFAFNLDKLNRAVTLACPSHAKVPSLEDCSRTDGASMSGSMHTRPEAGR